MHAKTRTHRRGVLRSDCKIGRGSTHIGPFIFIVSPNNCSVQSNLVGRNFDRISTEISFEVNGVERGGRHIDQYSEWGTFMVWGFGSRVSGFGLRAPGSGFEFRVSGFGFRGLRFGFQVSGLPSSSSMHIKCCLGILKSTSQVCSAHPATECNVQRFLTDF